MAARTKYQVQAIHMKSQYRLCQFFYDTYKKAQNKRTELLAKLPDTYDVELNTIIEL